MCSCADLCALQEIHRWSNLTLVLSCQLGLRSGLWRKQEAPDHAGVAGLMLAACFNMDKIQENFRSPRTHAVPAVIAVLGPWRNCEKKAAKCVSSLLSEEVLKSGRGSKRQVFLRLG